MKSSLKGGVIGLVIGLVVSIAWWLFASYKMQCLLEPIQVVNVGGGSCHFKDYFSIFSLLYFGLIALVGAIIGSMLQWASSHVNKTIGMHIIVAVVVLVIFIIVRSIN